MTLNGFGEFAALYGMGAATDVPLPWGITSTQWGTLDPATQAAVLETAGMENAQQAYNVLTSSGYQVTLPGVTAPTPTPSVIPGVSNTALLIGAAAFAFALILMRR